MTPQATFDSLSAMTDTLAALVADLRAADQIDFAERLEELRLRHRDGLLVVARGYINASWRAQCATELLAQRIAEQDSDKALAQARRMIAVAMRNQARQDKQQDDEE